MLSRSFSHLVHTALAAGALTLGGCGGDDTDNTDGTGGDAGTTGTGSGGDGGDTAGPGDDDGGTTAGDDGGTSPTGTGPGTDTGTDTGTDDGTDTTGTEEGTGSSDGSETGTDTGTTGSADTTGTTGSADTTGTTGSAETTGTTGSADTTGTTGAIDLPPVLIAGEFLGGSAVKLTFSEPVVLVNNPDPNQWRLSATHFYQYGPPAPIAPPGQAGSGGPYYGPCYYEGCTIYSDLGAFVYQAPGPLRATLIQEDPVDNDAIRLLLNQDVSYACNNHAQKYYENRYIDLYGIFPHFSNAGPGTVEDLTGNAVADIGNWWPEAYYTYNQTQYGYFPNLAPMIAIPCPPPPP